MSWEYRVVRNRGYLTVYRVYGYKLWTKNPHPGGDDTQDLQDDLNMMLTALNKPVLEERDGKLMEVEE